MEGDTETHVLGLHLRDTSVLERALAGLREMRERRARRIVEQLDSIGVHITMDAVLAQAADGAVGRPHVARALIAEGWAVDFRDAFDRYLAAGRPAYVPKEQLGMRDAVGMIHDAGGLAVLAHPAASGTRERLSALRAQGLDGVEVKHPSHSAADTARLAALARELDLVPSGGSDWHGASEGPRTIGMMQVPPNGSRFRRSGSSHWAARRRHDGARMTDLAGRVALVTGAGRRVGRALAVALGARGMHVVVHYHASAAGADETVAPRRSRRRQRTGHPGRPW